MHLRALAAETLGTFVVIAVLFATWLVARPSGGDIWAVALATGLALTAVTYAFGQVSGGHPQQHARPPEVARIPHPHKETALCH